MTRFSGDIDISVFTENRGISLFPKYLSTIHVFSENLGMRAFKRCGALWQSRGEDAETSAHTGWVDQPGEPNFLTVLQSCALAHSRVRSRQATAVV